MKSSQHQIVGKLKAKHPEYDYSLLPPHVTMKDRIRVLCPLHGEFTPTAHDHYYHNSKCPECSRLSKSKTGDRFITEARQVHGDRYDYSHVKYINNKTKVKIICSIHGMFEQTPYSHVNYGTGCPVCGGDGRRKPAEQFVSEAQAIHRNKYSYGNVVYVNTHTPVAITCSIHGDFLQSPTNHLNRKSGCPRCANHVKYTSEYFKRYPDEGQKRGFLYVVRLSDGDETFIKVGITKHKRITKRFEQNQPMPYKVDVINIWPATLCEAYTKEQEILKRMEIQKYTPQTQFSGQTECLTDSEITLKLIYNILRKSDNGNDQ